MIRSGPRSRLAAIAVLILVGTATLAPQSTAAASSDERNREPAAEFAYADATNSVASAIAGLGRTDYRDIFSGVKVDQATGKVRVYATDPTRAEELVASGLRPPLQGRAGRDLRLDHAQPLHARRTGAGGGAGSGGL